MSPEERRALLGNDVIEHIRQLVAAAPPPDAELVAALRPIFTNPGNPAPAAAASTPAAA
ncbi:hypothetical protein ACIGD1_11510 [Streptomyces sp. NPDC085612]|uniref:hypothetical protein n=1 Tax=Streptomyces sp. NPDC085612 TaxID=3365732 RepID=UPI0037CEBF01